MSAWIMRASGGRMSTKVRAGKRVLWLRDEV